MSSINNNGKKNTFVSPETLAETQLRQHAQKIADQAINKAHKSMEDGGVDVLGLLGMTPTGIKHALSGSTLKNNKFTVAGAATHMSAPKTPKHKPVNARTEQLYTAMHRDIHEAIGNTKVGLEKIDFKSLLAPHVQPAHSEAELHTQAEKIGKQTARTIEQIGNQLRTLSSSNLTLAFLMLRVNGQSDGLNIQNHMGDLASSLRKVSLDEQIAQSKAAEKALQKAMKKQEALKPLAPLLAVITAVLSVLFAVATLGSGLGLAVTAIAAAIGFITGGAVGGKKKGNGFDITSAFEGLSIGASVMPAVQMFKAILVGITNSAKAISDLLATAKAAAQKADTPASQGAKNVDKVLKNNNQSKDDGRNFGDLEEELPETINTEISKNVQQVVTDYAKRFIAKLSRKSRGETDKDAADAGSSIDPNASLIEKLIESPHLRFLGLSGKGKKVTITIEGVAMTLPSVSEVAKAAANYAVTEKNLDAQEHLNKSKLWGAVAKTEQGSWQGTQDVLSMLQEYHNQGVTQATTLLQAHHQAAMRAIQFNKA